MQRNKLQAQRLDKIKRDFAKQNYEEDRKLEQDKWMEHQNVIFRCLISLEEYH